MAGDRLVRTKRPGPFGLERQPATNRLAVRFRIPCGDIQDGLAVPQHFDCGLAIGYALLLAITIPFWQLPLQKAHGGDKRYFFYYLKRARGIEVSDFRDGPGKWADVDKVWFFGHIIFTVFFLALSWFVITQIAVPTANAKAMQQGDQ